MKKGGFIGMFFIIRTVIGLVMLLSVLATIYVWQRKDDQGKDIYPKDLAIASTFVLGLVLVILNISLII